LVDLAALDVISHAQAYRIWNTLAGKGWDDPKLRAQRFQQFGTSSVAYL